MLLAKFILTYRIIKLDPYLSPNAKTNSLWVKDLIVRLECLEGDIEKTLQDIYTSKGFLKRTRITPKITPRTDKLVCIELESLCTSKEIITNCTHNQQNGGRDLCYPYI